MRQFNVVYFTASCDPPETNRKFAESMDLDYVILSDPDKNVARKLGVLDEERSMARRWTYYIGDGGELLQIAKQVDARQHGAEIVAQLKELGVEKAKDDNQ